MTAHGDIEQLMRQRGLRPTANRILVARALAGGTAPQSLAEVEDAIGTMDASSVFRALTAFVEAGMAHAIEDGSGSLKYELCHGRHDHSGHEGHHDDDSHVHFYCQQCGKTFCFADMPVPPVPVPPGFTPTYTNYMIKGLCPTCSRAR